VELSLWLRDMPDVTWKKVAISARHRLFLEVAFSVQKAISKLLNNAFYATLCCQIKKLPWSDPERIALKAQSNSKSLSGCVICQM